MKKRIKSFGYAGRGISMVFRSEANMKIHITIAILVISCGFFFKISILEWMLCLICFSIVIGAEMMNTAIECIVDLVSPNHHILAGKAKDIAAGAVLICSMFSAIVGLIIFIPKGWTFLQHIFDYL